MQEDSQPLKRPIREQWSKLSKEQKIAFIILVICAVFAFVFSFISLRHGIYAPFLVSVDEIEAKKELLKDPIEQHTALKKRIDTDGDGLSDWAEENVYKTSPYLWSTAGDNLPDNVKIAMGLNPLCKEGQDCNAGALRYDLGTSTLPGNADISDRLQDSAGFLSEGQSSVKELEKKATALGVDVDPAKALDRDPQMIRNALLQYGTVSKERLDEITDEELLKFYDDAVAEYQAENNQAKDDTKTDL
ncbi:MAG: hypothetical protein ACOYUZ_05145 [Patescibacteria group bacterium]